MAATVYFRLNRPNQNGQPKTSPVSILISYYNKGLEVGDLSTGRKVIPSLWTGTRVEKEAANSARINKHLANLESKLLNVPDDHPGISKQEEERIVRAIIKGEPTGQQSEKKTVAEALTKFIAQYAREKESGTVKRYRGLLKKLNAFNPTLSFQQLDQSFYDEFKTFLYENPNPVYSGYRMDYDVFSGAYIMAPTDGDCNVGLFDDTVFKYFINLKTVIAWAEKRDYQVHQSYKSWEIIKREYDPISLTMDELNRIEGLSLSSHLDIARDYLVLECRTGQRISDLKRFDRSDIHGDEWTFKQKKGARLNQNQVTLPFVGYAAPALLILQKYNYQLPKISEQKLNKHIKTVCQKAGIDHEIYIERYAGSRKIRIPGKKYDFISTHTGRKTFVTLCLQDPHFTESMVMDITGIRSFKTLKHYKGKADMSNIRKALEGMSGPQQLMKVS